jgi:hypothetical protein
MAKNAPIPESDRVPPARDSPRYELETIGRSLSDREPDDGPPPGGVRAVVWVGVVLVALMAFVGWVLVGPPLPH